MSSTQKRHDDVIIQRRFGENTSTHAVKQIYAVTYPGHSDQGTERGSYDEAERIALTLAEEKGLSVWYEENPQDGRRTLVKSFRTRTSAFTYSLGPINQLRGARRHRYAGHYSERFG